MVGSASIADSGDWEIVDRALRSVAVPEDVKVEFELRPDSTGDDAVFIWLSINDADNVSARDAKRYSALAAALRGAVFNSGVKRFPYLHFREARRRRA